MGSQKGEKAGFVLSYGLMVMIVTHTLTHVFTRIHPAIFSLLRDEFSLSLQQLGIIAAIPPICQALLAIPTGLLSDRFGAKKMLLLSLMVATVGTLLVSLTINPAMFILAISLVYVNTTIYHPASYSFITRLFKPKDRPKALGLHGAGGTLGIALGPLLVSIIIGLLSLGWRHVYLVLAAPMLMGVIVVFLIRGEEYHPSPSDDEYKGKGITDVDTEDFRSLFTMSLAMFLVFAALRMMAGSMISNFIVLYLQDVRGLSIALASLVSSGTTLTGLLAAPLGGYWASRFGEKRWIIFSLSLGYLFLGLSMVSPNVTWFIILYIAYGFCNILAMAARSSIVAKLSPSGQRGLGYALFFLPGSVMGAVAPVLAGFVVTVFGFDVLFALSLLIFIIALAILKFKVKVD